jgi:hypothetical protein
MPDNVLLIIIRQIKSMPKHFSAKDKLCRKTVMLNEVCQMILYVKFLCNLKESCLIFCEFSTLEDYDK